MDTKDAERIVRLATGLTQKLELIIQRMDSEFARNNLFVLETTETLDSLRAFLVLMSRYSNVDDLSVLLHPVSRALLDMKITGATPPMFKRKAMSKSPMQTREKQIRLVCAWLQEMYRLKGIKPSRAVKRVSNILRKLKTESQPEPETATLRKWYTNTKINKIWYDEYQSYFNKFTVHELESKLKTLSEIDSYGERLIRYLRFGP